jgi:hypothetical protein
MALTCARYAEKKWSTNGSKVAGKLHFFCGDMDDFFLTLPFISFQDFLKAHAILITKPTSPMPGR